MVALPMGVHKNSKYISYLKPNKAIKTKRENTNLGSLNFHLGDHHQDIRSDK